MASSERRPFLDLSLKEFLDAVPARTPAPGGGAVAAIATSLAAGLTAMAARFAPEDWERRAQVVGRAEELRARVEPLADADADAYGAYMASPSAEATERIIEIPLEITEIAAETAELAHLVARDGNPTVSGDAAAGAQLAAAAAAIGREPRASERAAAERPRAERARRSSRRKPRRARRRPSQPSTSPTTPSRRAALRPASTRASRAAAGRS